MAFYCHFVSQSVTIGNFLRLFACGGGPNRAYATCPYGRLAERLSHPIETGWSTVVVARVQISHRSPNEDMSRGTTTRFNRLYEWLPSFWFSLASGTHDALYNFYLIARCYTTKVRLVYCALRWRANARAKVAPWLETANTAKGYEAQPKGWASFFIAASSPPTGG